MRSTSPIGPAALPHPVAPSILAAGSILAALPTLAARSILSLLPVLATLPILAACAAGPDLTSGRWIDLTHEFSADTVYWPTADGFELTVVSKGLTEAGYWYEANAFRAAEHGGTHLDAPVHFAKGKDSAEAVPLERLIGPAVVVDVSARALADRDYQVRVDDFRQWEAEHGRIPDGAIVLLRTGYGRFWPDKVRYMGTAGRGLEATFELSFPGLHPAAARWLVEERAVGAVGLDTPSIDHGKSRLFHSHRVLFAANVPAFENVANLDELPATGAWVVALPMKIKGGSGGPLRIVAWLPERTEPGSVPPPVTGARAEAPRR